MAVPLDHLFLNKTLTRSARLALLSLSCVWCLHAAAQASNPPSAPSAAAASQSKPKPGPGAASKVAASSWQQLTAAQQTALKPLAANWDQLSDTQKLKWLSVSRNYPQMPPAAQARLHSRMTEWVALSPRQRQQARLNFAGAKDLTPDERKAQWQAYQALSPEERQKLAASGKAKPSGAAIIVKPVPPQKLAVLPKQAASGARGPRVVPPSRIAVGPSAQAVDPHTLLPQPAPPAATPH